MRHGKSQVELAKIVGVSKQEVAHVGNGRYQDGKVVRDTAAAIGASVDWLTKGLGAPPAWYADPGAPPAAAPRRLREGGAGYRSDPPPAFVLTAPRTMPMLGTAGAADSGQRGLLFTEPELRQLSPDLALIEVHGRSAYPVVYDGQLAVVHLKRPVRPNNLVVVVMGDGDGEVLVKRWCPQRDDHVVLASPNGGRDSLVIHKSEVRHCWPVIGVMFELPA